MSLISTIRASCRDCYKCVRYCPVKAIKISGGHAEVIEERCIGDGRCVTICPQKAKKVQSNLEIVKGYLKSGLTVVASLAPSFMAAYQTGATVQPLQPEKIVAAVKQLGFTYVTETAEGAEWVAQEHLKLVERNQGPVITSCCPAIVNLIEIYYPQLVSYLAPVVSPMVAHGDILKQRYGSDCKVVFIGPCFAKKSEKNQFNAVDAVLTFQELAEIWQAAGVKPEEMENLASEAFGVTRAYAFPAPGGLARTASLSTDLLAKDIVAIDGLTETIDFLDSFNQIKDSVKLVELLACRGGCLAGPAIDDSMVFFKRREQLLNYAEAKNQSSQFADFELATTPVKIAREFRQNPKLAVEPGENVIKEILALTGKYQPSDELNCGACGYNSCRDKAVAVARGMAEVDMCIPYMRAKAESRANLICQLTPNAIFVVDHDLKILEVNPAAEQKFLCKQEKVVGNKLESIMDPGSFEQALQSKSLVTGDVVFPAYGIIAWQAIFYVEKEEVLIGIFADVTKEKQQRAKLDLVTEETLAKAQEVIDKQMRVAQEIAGLLGETTAETKVQLTKLMRLLQNEAGKGR